MLPFFPTPYPDELLYSVLARYAVRTGNTSPKMTLNDLFGFTTLSAVVDLPSHIDCLVNHLPTYSKFTAEELIYEHTLFPFYAPFLPVERFQMFLSGMRGDFGGNLHCMTGIMAGAFPEPRFLRFCSACNRNDYQLHGEYYWHRIHQVPGVMICPEHNLPLLDSAVPYRRNNKHEYIPALSEYFRAQVARELSEICNKRQHQIAHDCQWLLNNRVESPSLNWFRDKYIATLALKGLVSPKGFVDQIILIEEFLSFFGHDTLKLLHSDIDIEKETGWLRSIVRKHRKAFHPIRHILMMQYLAESTERFLTMEHTFKPFGNPPWLCLNPVSTHYQQPVITTVRVTTCSDTGRPVGTFACSCGFVYSRRGPDQNYQDRFHVGRIKAFGPLWESKLEQVLDSRSIGLREAGRIMRCDPKSIVKYAKKLGISVIWNTKTSVKTSAHVDLIANNLEQRRTQWIKLTDEYPEISISLLRRKNPGLYAWLYRHDREWLRLVFPISMRCGNNNLRLNWNTRDEIILVKVMQCVQNILNFDGKPIRITVGTVGKIIGARALLEKHLNRLSRTKNFLEFSLETVEDFQCRRIRWAADVLNRRGEQVREWKIIRIAGIRPGFSHKIADEIEQQIVRYSPKTIGQVGR